MMVKPGGLPVNGFKRSFDGQCMQQQEEWMGMRTIFQKLEWIANNWVGVGTVLLENSKQPPSRNLFKTIGS